MRGAISNEERLNRLDNVRFGDSELGLTRNGTITCDRRNVNVTVTDSGQAIMELARAKVG